MGNNVIHAEWIGKHAKIVRAKNPSHANITGVVVDETKNTITIQTEKGIKKVPKHGSVFNINGHEVQGDDVLAAPEERIKIKTE